MPVNFADLNNFPKFNGVLAELKRSASNGQITNEQFANWMLEHCIQTIRRKQESDGSNGSGRPNGTNHAVADAADSVSLATTVGKRSSSRKARVIHSDDARLFYHWLVTVRAFRCATALQYVSKLRSLRKQGLDPDQAADLERILEDLNNRPEAYVSPKITRAAIRAYREFKNL